MTGKTLLSPMGSRARRNGSIRMRAAAPTASCDAMPHRGRAGAFGLNRIGSSRNPWTCFIRVIGKPIRPPDRLRYIAGANRGRDGRQAGRRAVEAHRETG